MVFFLSLVSSLPAKFFFKKKRKNGFWELSSLIKNLEKRNTEKEKKWEGFEPRENAFISGLL